jgi:hypothetical protein
MHRLLVIILGTNTAFDPRPPPETVPCWVHDTLLSMRTYSITHLSLSLALSRSLALSLSLSLSLSLMQSTVLLSVSALPTSHDSRSEARLNEPICPVESIYSIHCTVYTIYGVRT